MPAILLVVHRMHDRASLRRGFEAGACHHRPHIELVERRRRQAPFQPGRPFAPRIVGRVPLSDEGKNAGKPLASGRVARLVDILAALKEEEEAENVSVPR
jgi:hypothetical protein